MNNLKIGFTIGKFAPLHRGHQLLIETALREMDKFIVVIYETDNINVPINIRANWIKDLYPNIEVRYAMNPPDKYGLDDDSVKIQMEYLIKIIKDINPTHFYSSEAYGKCVADYLNIIDRRIDNKRNIIPITSTTIRENLDRNKIWIEKNVYIDLKKYENNEGKIK